MEESNFIVFEDEDFTSSLDTVCKNLSICVNGWEVKIQSKSENSVNIIVINPSNKLIKEETLHHTVPVG